MFRWFETRIDPFPEDPPERPPTRLVDFYWHYVKPVWPVFLVLLVVGGIGSLIEVALFAFVGSLVDLMRDSHRRPRRSSPTTVRRCCGWRSSR